MHILWDGVKHGEEQGFVAEHDGVFLFADYLRCVSLGCFYPFGQEAGLCIFGGSGDITYLFRLPEDVEITFRQFVGEVDEVAFDKFSGFVLGDSLGIEEVVIPIKHGFPGFLQLLEEFFLYFVQYVETDEYVFIVFEPVGIELFDNVPVEHTFVGNAQFGKLLPITMIDNTQFVPEGYEFFLEFGTPFDGEVLKELPDGFFLFFIEEFVVVHQVLQVLQIAEQFVCIHHIFVYVVEIANQQFTPEVEIVQRLPTFGFFFEYFIKLADQTDRIPYLLYG